MQGSFRALVVLAAALAMTAPPAEAHGRSSGGKSPGSGKPHAHHRHAHPRFTGGALLLFGPPLLFYGSPAYYYTPPYAGAQPRRFIEQYHGEPAAGTSERFLCPEVWQEYPDVTQCPGGWARILERPDAPSF